MTYQIEHSNDPYHSATLVYDKATGMHIYSYTRKISVPNGTVVCILGSEHRPSSEVYVEALCKHDISGIGTGRLTVMTNGSVVLASIDYNEPLKGSFTIVW